MHIQLKSLSVAQSGRRWSGAVLTSGLMTLAGCSGGADALPTPGYNPSGSAAKAMELYDANSDGFVDGDELKKAPGLKAAMKNLDKDGDGKVSEQEIVDRIEAWDKMQIGLMNVSCDVLLNGRPLEGATVSYDPDEFLKNTLQPAVGTTSMAGGAHMSIPKDKRPSPTSPPGLQAGIYKVRITKQENGEETIPAKYNAETVLGQEVSTDDKSITEHNVVYKLKTK